MSYKIFLLLLSIGTLFFSTMLWLCLTALEAEGSPEAIMDRYRFYNDFLTYGTPLVFLGLMGIANHIAIKQNRHFPMLWSLLFFWVITNLDYAFIGEVYFRYIKQTGQWQGGFSILAIAGLLMSFLGGVMVLINYWILNLWRKMKSL